MSGNGRADSQPTKKPKPDLEIPRKVLHTSIGLLSLLIIVCVAYLARFFTLHLYVSQGKVRVIALVLWILAIIVPADLLRFGFKGFARTYTNLLGFLMRESERRDL